MKIFFPIGSFYPAQSGGPNNTIYWMGKNFVKSGMEVTVLTTNTGINDSHNIKLNEWCDIDGIKTKYISTKIHQLPISLLIQSIKQIRKADVVHLNSLFYLPSFIIGFICALMRKHVVWSVRGELHDGAFQYSTAKKRLLLSIIKFYSGKRFCFHGTSEEELECISKRLNKTGVYAANYMELPQKYEVELQNSIAFLGRIHPLKALHKLIKGASKSEEFKKQKTTLNIVGYEDKPGYLGELKTLAEKTGIEHQVIFHQPKSGKEKYEFFATARFKVLVSESENFGNVVVEALSQNTPIIASKGTPWEILEINKAGFWIENNPESIAKTLDKALAIPIKEYQIMRSNAYNLVKNEFDIAVKYNIWTDIYTQLVNPK